MKRSKQRARREAGNVFIPSGRGRAVDVGGQLEVARCPLCDGPMTPRLGRQGPYFYCFCHIRKEQASVAQAVSQPAEERQARSLPLEMRIENKLLAGSESPPHLRFPSCNHNLSSVG